MLQFYPKWLNPVIRMGITPRVKNPDTCPTSKSLLDPHPKKRWSSMHVAHRNTDTLPGSRVYRNRPTIPACSTATETLGDVVYLVDNDPLLQKDMLTVLSEYGTKVVIFSSASECLAFTGKDAAACVITNSQLPDLSGLELQSRLAAKANPPVIFVSDQSDINFVVSAMKAGAIDFLTKPIDLPALIAAVRSGLAQDRRFRQRKAELADLRARLSLLTPREREVLPLVVSGLLNKQAASVLCISEVTLQIHRSQVMRKMRAASLAELVRMALKLRIPHWCEYPPVAAKLQEAPLSA